MYHLAVPPTPPPDPKRAPADPLERQILRVEKLAGFGAQLSGALRTEFMYYWDHPQRRIEVPESGPFVARVDALRALTARILRDVARLHHLPPVQQTHVLKQIDLGALLEAGKGLEGTARVLRERARERGWGSGRVLDAAAPWATAEGWLRLFGSAAQAEAVPPGGAGSGVGWVTGKLQGMLDRAVSQVVQRPTAPPPPLHPGARRLQAYENALQLVSEILAETGPRLAVLRVALARNAGEDAATPARLPAELADLIPDVAASLKDRPPIARSAGVAVQQGVMAKKMYEEYKAGLEAA
ncbi:MAG: hypothetical protein JWM80_1980, partial [Cyanobacteria bacterium RYN_339]|nr:hypothetical protein [Cyanobacteria bacterium RYN_339]